MTIKSQEDFIRVEVQVAENTAETVVEDTLSLPSHRRQCDQILKAEALPKVTLEKVEEDKIVIEGVLDVNVIYASEEESGDDYLYYCDSARWENALPFVYFLDMPGAEPGMVTQTELTVQDLQTTSQDGTSIDVSAVVGIKTKVSKLEDVDLLTGCTAMAPDKIKVEKDVLKVEDFIGHESAMVGISDDLTVAPDKPDADQVLDYEVFPEIISSEVVVGRIVVKGYVSYKVMYQNTEGAAPAVAFAEWKDSTPFEAVLEIEEARPGMKPEISVSVSKAHLKPAAGGREVAVDGELKVSAKLVEPRQLNVLTNITSETDNEVAVRKEFIRIDNMVGAGHRQVTSEGLLDLPEPHPPIGELLDFSSEATIDEVHVTANRVNVEGHLSVQATYAAHSDSAQPVHFVRWSNVLPFNTSLDVIGAESGMDCEANVKVLSCEPDLINRETVEARAVLSLSAKVKETVEKEVVAEAVALSPIVGRPPTITCLVVQSGDTLWKLAKRYRTSEEAILQANPWLQEKETQFLEVGWRIYIPKAVPAAS